MLALLDPDESEVPVKSVVGVETVIEASVLDAVRTLVTLKTANSIKRTIDV